MKQKKKLSFTEKMTRLSKMDNERAALNRKKLAEGGIELFEIMEEARAKWFNKNFNKIMDTIRQ